MAGMKNLLNFLPARRKPSEVCGGILISTIIITRPSWTQSGLSEECEH